MSREALALEANAVVLIDGAPLPGCERSVVRTAVDRMIIATLDNFYLSIALDSNWQMITHGVIIITAVGLDQFARRRAR